MFYEWNVIGHEKQLERLEADLQREQVPHAYLFVGPEKIGKSHIAKVMAGILQCPSNFCRSCPTCVQVTKKCHADTIQLVDDGESIKVAAVRDIASRLSMTSQSRYKILIIENIGRFTDEASSAFLKTLEEPTPRTIFIFTAIHLKDIMPTIASRMAIIHFKKPPEATLMKELVRMYPDENKSKIEAAVSLALGLSGQAIELLKDPSRFDELQELYHRIESLHQKASTAERMVAMNALAKDPAKLSRFLLLLGHYLRTQALRTTQPKRRLAIVALIERLHAATNLIEKNVNVRLVLEDLMIHL